MQSCQRYWTAGGVIREVPVGAGKRKPKKSRQRNNASRQNIHSFSPTVYSRMDPHNMMPVFYPANIPYPGLFLHSQPGLGANGSQHLMVNPSRDSIDLLESNSTAIDHAQMIKTNINIASGDYSHPANLIFQEYNGTSLSMLNSDNVNDQTMKYPILAAADRVMPVMPWFGQIGCAGTNQETAPDEGLHDGVDQKTNGPFE